jgi:hypothetical protein
MWTPEQRREYNRIYMRERVPKEKRRQWAREFLARLDPKQRYLYRRAHWWVARAVKNGIIKKEDCAICSNPNVQAHHEDYNEPLEVIWLCPIHHRRIEQIKSMLSELAQASQPLQLMAL